MKLLIILKEYHGIVSGIMTTTLITSNFQLKWMILKSFVSRQSIVSQVGNQLEISIKSFCDDFIEIEEYGEHIIDLLKIYRKQSFLNNDPKGFNELMINHMKPFRGTTFWYLMLSHEIGLIGRTECQMSHLSQEDVENFTNLSDDYIKIESD